MKESNSWDNYPLVPATAGLPVQVGVYDGAVEVSSVSIDAQMSVGEEFRFHDDDFCFHNAGTCPECGGGMVRSGACFSCPVCGFGSCEG